MSDDIFDTMTENLAVSAIAAKAAVQAILRYKGKKVGTAWYIALVAKAARHLLRWKCDVWYSTLQRRALIPAERNEHRMVRTMNSLCQLATDWRGDLPNGGVMAEAKIDGWRCLWLTGIDGKPRLFTRQGHLIEGASHIAYRLSLMEREAGEPMVFDGEFQVGGSLAATKVWCERGWKVGREEGTLYLFDCLTMAEWRAGGSDMPLYTRKARLHNLARAVDEDETLSWEFRPGSRGDEHWRNSCPILPDNWLSDAGEVLVEAQRVWAAGDEGLMLKDAEAPYRRNRNASWLKVKKENYRHWRRAA